MNPTSGPWTYNPDYDEVRWIGHPIAKIKSGYGSPDALTRRANGYLMAAAPELRDELTNLSRAVTAYLDVDINDDDEKERTHNQLEVMLERAEHALGHIFPPEGTS